MSKRIVAILLSFFVYGFFLGFPISNVQADNDTQGVQCQITVNGQRVTTNNGSLTTIPFASSSDGTKQTYNIEVCGDLTQANGSELILAQHRWGDFGSQWTTTSLGNPSATEDSCVSGSFEVEFANVFLSAHTEVGSYLDIETANGNVPICRRGYVKLRAGEEDNWLGWESSKNQMCDAYATPASNITTNDQITVHIPMPNAFVTNKTSSGFTNPSGATEDYIVIGSKEDGTEFFTSDWLRNFPIENGEVSFSFIGSDLGVGTYTIRIDQLVGNRSTLCESYKFTVGTPENPGESEDLFDPETGQGDKHELTKFTICGQLIEGSGAKEKCDTCYDDGGIWTAVGCIDRDPGKLIAALVTIGLNLGGGVALLMILAAGFMFSTSQGDPNKTKEAKDMMQAAVIGLLFIIFSVSILQFIGVDILRIPGFGDSSSSRSRSGSPQTRTIN